MKNKYLLNFERYIFQAKCFHLPLFLTLCVIVLTSGNKLPVWTSLIIIIIIIIIIKKKIIKKYIYIYTHIISHDMSVLRV